MIALWSFLGLIGGAAGGFGAGALIEKNFNVRDRNNHNSIYN